MLRRHKNALAYELISVCFCLILSAKFDSLINISFRQVYAPKQVTVTSRQNWIKWRHCLRSQIDFFLVMASLCHFFVRPPLQTAICYHSTVITAGHASLLPQRKCNEDLFCDFDFFRISKYATESMLNSTPLPIIIMLPSSFQTFQTHNYSVSKAPTSEFRLTIM